MRSITYPARDGTMIPGYLTLPAGESSRRYPVIVMPHDGPDARDSWEFDYLRHFLVSRDYAVLQMNFRGSAGLGWQWLDAAHQDWGGLSFDDIIDGAEWASSQSFADPERMCILGRGFGGYAALLAAVRGSAGFRCSISIGGPSDLQELADDARIYLQHEVVTEQIGKKRAKLKLDSPLQHAEQASIPILLVHGSHDWEVLVHHSRDMARALKRVGKPHELLVIEEATHGLRWESDRIALLAAIEKFLATHLK
jgi:dipeptidyl aminopeptidase/acylaminoacyl peptidase